MSETNQPTTNRTDPEYVQQLLEKMEPDAAEACLKVINWMGDRPQTEPHISQAEMERLVEEMRLEIIRARLGEVVGKVLPFAGNSIE